MVRPTDRSARVYPLFDATTDPAEADRAALYIGERGTFTALKLSALSYELYLHDEITPGGILVAGGGGGGAGSVSALSRDPADGFTMTHDDGQGNTTQFSDANISTDIGNLLSRGSDGGLRVIIPDTP